MCETQYLLTVLMPAHNAGQYIRQAIDSVLNQTYRNFEFLIIDDGSMDDTKSIIESYRDKRIKLISTSHSGISKALNTGLRLAEGKYIARFDADDICLPHRLQKQISFLQENPEYILVGSAIDYVNSTGQHLFTYHNAGHSDHEIKRLRPEVCPFVHSSVCYKKSVVLDVHGYDENAHSFEDHLLWKKLLPLGKVCNMPEVLVKARFNPESFTIDERWRSKRFKQIKIASLQRGFTTRDEGTELLSIIRNQNTSSIKRGSYHALIGKKYLWNNYNPQLARKNFIECWKMRPQLTIILLWLVSFLPKRCIALLYRSVKKNLVYERVYPN